MKAATQVIVCDPPTGAYKAIPGFYTYGGSAARGKHVGHHAYYHAHHVPLMGGQFVSRVLIWMGSADPANLQNTQYNVIKISLPTRNYAGGEVTFLQYRNFMDSPFPELVQSCKLDPLSPRPGDKDYKPPRILHFKSHNPPILHRKERLLPVDHPEYEKARAVTRKCEDAGLFRDSKRIGHKLAWEKLLKAAGLYGKL